MLLKSIMFGWLKIRKPKPTAGPRSSRIPAGTLLPAIDPEIIQPHPLLALLPPGALERLLGDSALAEYPKGTTIYREGEACEAIYLIFSGRCESRRREAGGELVEMVSGPGDM